MNFLDFEEGIIEKVKNDFSQFLQECELENFDGFINDFLDFDKYTKPKLLFFDFDSFTFNALSNETNEAQISLTIRMAFRKNNTEALKKMQLEYTTAFFNWFYGFASGDFCRLVDYGKIDSVEFYDAVNGDTSIKLSEIKISLEKEV